MTHSKPFGMIEVAVVELIQALDPTVVDELIGGDLSYESSDDFYVWVGMTSGSTSETDGEWVVDIDVFDSTYGQAMRRSLALEIMLLSTRGFSGSEMRIDRVYQNESPAERPWDDDDSAYRVGASYVFSARRSSGQHTPSPGGTLDPDDAPANSVDPVLLFDNIISGGNAT